MIVACKRSVCSSAGNMHSTRSSWAATVCGSPTVVTAPEGNPAQYAVVHPIPNAPACATCHGTAQHFNGWLDLRFTRNNVIAQQAKLAHTLGLSAAAAFVCLMAIAWWLLGREAVVPLTRLVT